MIPQQHEDKQKQETKRIIRPYQGNSTLLDIIRNIFILIIVKNKRLDLNSSNCQGNKMLYLYNMIQSKTIQYNKHNSHSNDLETKSPL